MFVLKQNTSTGAYNLELSPYSEDSIVIGTSYNGVRWYEVGYDLGYKYFYGQSYQTYEALYPEQTYAANQTFIRNAVYNNDTIYCSHNPDEYFDLVNGIRKNDTAFAKELELIYNICGSIMFESGTIIKGRTVWKINYTK